MNQLQSALHAQKIVCLAKKLELKYFHEGPMKIYIYEHLTHG